MKKIIPPTSPSILTPEITKKVIDCLIPSIGLLLKMHNREFLHVVVCDHSGNIFFDRPVAGTVETYPKPYGQLAHAKAAFSLRTGLNTGEVIANAPHLMLEGDILYQGGVNYDGLVVAASGSPAPLDEAISTMIAANLSAYCAIYVKKLQGRQPITSKDIETYFVPKSD